MNVKLINKSNNPTPEYKTPKSAGLDLQAHLPDGAITIHPGRRALVKTGLHIQLPGNFEAQIRPRSGLALKKGITVLNSPGTIDADYTGEIGVILINHGPESVRIYSGDRICQMVINKVEHISFKIVDELEATERGNGGFGSTGKN